MEGKYKYNFIKNNFQNLSYKELERFYLLQKLKSFYIKKGIKEGRLFYKRDVIEDTQKLLNYSLKKYFGNFTSETQLEALTLKNREQLTKIIHKQHLASLLEIAYLDLSQEFKISPKIFQMEFEKELNKEIENIININLNNNDNILDYRKKIVEFLGVKEYEISLLIDEIKHLCEFKKVLIFIVVCDSVAELPKRDRKKLYEKKRKFERLKESTISNLKTLNLSFEEVESKEFTSSEALGWHNYETTLKHYQAILFFVLTDRCKTGVKRAKEIIGILDYL